MVPYIVATWRVTLSSLCSNKHIATEAINNPVKQQRQSHAHYSQDYHLCEGRPTGKRFTVLFVTLTTPAKDPTTPNSVTSVCTLAIPHHPQMSYRDTGCRYSFVSFVSFFGIFLLIFSNMFCNFLLILFLAAPEQPPNSSWQLLGSSLATC